MIPVKESSAAQLVPSLQDKPAVRSYRRGSDAAMAAPYWGNMDPPVVTAPKRSNSLRQSDVGTRGSDDQSAQRLPPQQQSKPERLSTQSYAPTESTQSSFASPISSTFRTNGLAPRPTSFPYAVQDTYQNEYLERRRRRQSRDPDQYYDENDDSLPPPAAPDVPRAAPPVSYRQPYTNGQTSSSYQPPARTRSTRRADDPIETTQPPQDSYYQNGPPTSRTYRSEADRRPVTNDSEQRRARNYSIGREDDADSGLIRQGSVDARRDRPEFHNVAASSKPRQGSSVDVEAQRRREWAPDRSPLQRLELTLDSITKEEKRARVEEAELLAREAKAGRGGQNSVHWRNRPSVSAQAEPQTLAEAGLVRNLSTKQKEELQRSGTVERTRPAPVSQLGRGFEYQPSDQATATTQAADTVTPPQRRAPALEQAKENTSIPKRGGSFRERAAAPAAAAVASGLGRSNSNKLRKEPPGDPWYSKRQEAERKAQEVASRRQSSDTRRKVSTESDNQQNSGQASVQPRASVDDRPQGSKRQAISHPLDIPDLYSDEEDAPIPARRKSTKKVEQLMGLPMEGESSRSTISPRQQPARAVRQDRLQELDAAGSSSLSPKNRLPQLKTENLKSTPTSSLGPSPWTQNTQNTQNRISRASESIHDGQSRRSVYLPGDGIYAPSHGLNEWKTGGIAVLTAELLDLDARSADLDRSRAWWEGGNYGRRKSTAGKQRAVEGYDGEDDDSGTVFSASYDLEKQESHYVPVIGTEMWMMGLDPVAPRTRQYIGYQGTSNSKAKVRRRNRSWRKPPPKSSSEKPEFEAPRPKNRSFTLFSYSPDCLNKSEHNILHPFHVCHKPKIERTKLTRSMRAIRIRTPAVPTSFKPPLFLKCGPLLRYCGLRHERPDSRQTRSVTPRQHVMWRGSVMIVTLDAKSTYEPAPVLRLFSQPIKLLPPPPAQVDGGADIAPEYIDPIAGLPKIGRDGRTLYVRPVEDLPEGKDISREESDEGIYESERTATSPVGGYDGTTIDGEKVGKSVEVPGIRLHAERGMTFWRFNLEVELTNKQQRIAYRINRGPSSAFWVPARDQSMNIMFHSCNGFSMSVNSDLLSGPDPMWRDVLNTHQTQPFHVMIGGGDQIYNDLVMKETMIFQDWLAIKNPLQKHNAPFTLEMQNELEDFYLQRYCMWFSQGLFGLANAQIPMVNIWDDHDIIDGFGSYPDHFMDSPVFSGLGAIAFKYYMLFQHQSVIDEGEETEPSWLLGHHPGPYIKELSRSVFVSLGKGVSFLGLDCRTERSRDDIVSQETMDKVLNRCQRELVKGETKHLIVLLGVPIAYPRLVWLENIMTSRLWDPVKAVSRGFNRRSSRGGFVNQFDGGVEILDDLEDHWTAKIHKNERADLINDLQDLAAEKSVRITILSGDVHLAAIGQFYSHPKLAIPKDKDHRYMPNVVSSAIVNTPPPEMMTDVLNRRNKIHHLDDFTEEEMIPIFTQDVNGAKRNNKTLLPRRNWCSIRLYNPELSPPPTPVDERSPSPPPRGLLRRLSSSRGPSFRPDAGPPVSGGLMRRFSLSGRRASVDTDRPDARAEQPAQRPRAMSLSGRDFTPGALFRRMSNRHHDDGGINGYGSDSDNGQGADEQVYNPRLRGGAGDESMLRSNTIGGGTSRRTRITRNDVRASNHYDDVPLPSHAPTAPPPSQQPQLPQPMQQVDPPRRPFHRTPTGMSEKQRKHLGEHEVNLEGGLDICLNVEVSQRDPAGITVPYRLLVPALWYQEPESRASIQAPAVEKRPSGLTRLMSIGRGQGQKPRVVTDPVV